MLIYSWRPVSRENSISFKNLLQPTPRCGGIIVDGDVKLL